MILGLVGFSRSGKDTAAANMPNFKRFAFADALKDDIRVLLSVLGIAGVSVDLSDPEVKGKCRPLLVEWGRTARAFDPLFWIKRLKAQIANFQDYTPGGHQVITDCRYKNEYDAIKDAGGTCIYIHRPGIFAANEEEKRSIEEILFRCNVTSVVNDGTPEELGDKVLRAVGLRGTANG